MPINLQTLRRAAALVVRLVSVLAIVLVTAAVMSRIIPSAPPLASREAYMVAAGFLVGCIAVLGASAHLMADYSASGPFEGAKMLLGRLLGRLGPTQVIENGLSVQPKGPIAGPLMGPRSVVLRGSAAIFYQGPRQTGVEGGITYVSKPREYAHKTYDLHPKQQIVYIEPVLTSDQMPVCIKVLTSSGILVRFEVVEGKEPLNDEEKQRIAKLDLETPDIDELVSSVVERVMRREAGRLTYDRLTRSSTLALLDHTLLARINADLNPRGLRMHRLNVTSVQPTDAVLKATATAKAESARDLERAASWRDALHLLASGYSAARQIAEQWDDVDPAFLRGLSDILKKFPELADSKAPAYLAESLEKRTGDKSSGESRAPNNAITQSAGQAPAPNSGTGAGAGDNSRPDPGASRSTPGRAQVRRVED